MKFPKKSSIFYTIPSATLSAVIAPGLTEIHRSSAFDEFFFFFASDLVVAIESRLPQQQLPAPWRQQQQWQHTMNVVMMTRRGKVRRTTRHTVLKTPWLCLSVIKLHNCRKKSSTLSIFVLQKSGKEKCEFPDSVVIKKRLINAARHIGDFSSLSCSFWRQSLFTQDGNCCKPSLKCLSNCEPKSTCL